MHINLILFIPDMVYIVYYTPLKNNLHFFIISLQHPIICYIFAAHLINNADVKVTALINLSKRY